MKALQDRQQGLRTRLRNNQREINRLMSDYENYGATVVTGDQVPGMKQWLVNDRPRRRAPIVRSPDPLDNTQTTDGSTQPSQSTIHDSQISDAASDAAAEGIFSDDYTGSSEEEVEEERSVNTETGMPDTQASDSPYLTRSQKKRRRKKEKKASKKEKKDKRSHKKTGGKRSPPNSPSH